VYRHADPELRQRFPSYGESGVPLRRAQTNNCIGLSPRIVEQRKEDICKENEVQLTYPAQEYVPALISFNKPNTLCFDFRMAQTFWTLQVSLH
jgi:hypothetical protein